MLPGPLKNLHQTPTIMDTCSLALIFALGCQLYWGAVMLRITLEVLQMEMSQCLHVARTHMVEHPGMPQQEIILPSQQSLNYALKRESSIELTNWDIYYAHQVRLGSCAKIVCDWCTCARWQINGVETIVLTAFLSFKCWAVQPW